HLRTEDPMRRRFAFVTPAVFALIAAGCSDANAPDRSRPGPTVASADESLSEGRGDFQRYVAIGPSISAGVQGDGNIAATQQTSWPAQLAALAHRTIPQPYIAFPGCRSPLAAPLASGVRLSGEPAGQDPNTLSCAPLLADVVKPVQNLAINGALTKD